MKKGEAVYNVIVIGAGTAGLVRTAVTAGLGGPVPGAANARASR
jgi:hypothetical protein